MSLSLVPGKILINNLGS